MTNIFKSCPLGLVIIALIFSLQISAQTTFQKQYQIGQFHHFTECVQQTDDLGYIFQGWKLDVSFPLMKMTLVKTDTLGNVEWQKDYCKCITNPPLCLSCGAASIMGGCIQQTNDGGFIMSGSADDKMLLVKTDGYGNVTWAKTYGSGSYGKYVRQTADYGYICVGYSGSNIFIVKTDASGTLQWDRAYQLSPNYNDAAMDVDQINSGDFIVTGYSTTIFNPGPSADTTTDIVLLKLNSSGTLQWIRTYGQDSESEEGHAVSKTSDGGYIVTGHTSQTGSGLSAADVFIWKFSSSDSPQFQYSYKVGGFLSLDISFGYAGQQTSDGGYALFGVTTGFGLTSISYFSNFMLKLNNIADIEFCMSYKDSVSGAPISMGYSIWNDGKQLADGGYLLGGCGILNSGIGLGHKLIKTNSYGSSGCSENTIYPTRYNFAPAAENQSPTNLATGSSDNINMFVSDPGITEETVCIFTPLIVDAGMDYSMCENTTSWLGWSPTASGGTGTYSYSWQPTTYLDDPYSANPAITPMAEGTYTYTVTVTSGSQTGTDDITITVLPAPDATLEPFENICISSDPFTISGGSPTGGNYYIDGVIGTTFNPATAGLGTHIISYILIGGNGCTDTAFQEIIVYDPNPDITPAGPYCSDDPADTLQAASPGGMWSGVGITDPYFGVFNPSVAGLGTHWIKYGFPSPCLAYDSIQITVIQAANATIYWPGLLCVFDALDTLTAYDPDGIWSGDHIVNATTGTFSPSTAGIGSHQIIYTISGQCGDADTLNVIVAGQLSATITDISPLCSNALPVTLVAVDSSGIWTGLGITNPVLGIFTPDTAGAGTHLIIYTIPGSCGDKDSTYITIYSSPALAASISNESCTGANDGSVKVTITGGTPLFEIAWDGDTSSQSGNTFNKTTLNPGEYFIAVSDSNGCKDTVTYKVLASDINCSIYIPNIFSPNGDGANDIFVVRGLRPGDVKEIKLAIYDRWGENVYISENAVEILEIGWDGKYKNKEMNTAVFAYYFKVVLNNDETVVRKGNVTIVR
ncbi:MAG: gliding motility-associated C-terminal domain-containing protein [Bacteroidales bacterium]|jgi:gliding motility-associated-like protein|nr:gliding motility-associated C-terminal domain-containing protein [Bacteroidales bacterium]